MRAFALALVLAAGCTEPDPRYCAGDDACFDGKVCGIKHFCVETDGGAAGPDLAPQCTTSSDCAQIDKPVCEKGSCRGCQGEPDDPECAKHGGKVCASGGGACVGCRDAMQCGGKTPICLAGACAPCVAHADCPSLVCKDDGSCEAEANLIYVDRGPCMNQAPTGERAKPYCEIQEAVGKGRSIRVIGNGSAYKGVDLSGQSAVIIGPGLEAIPPARIAGGNAPGINVTGNIAQVTLDGLVVTTSTVDGIACSNTQLGPTLTVVRTQVAGVAGVGLSANRCHVTLDRDRLGPMNGGGGLLLTGSTYQVTNTVVAENGPGGPSVTLGASSTGTFSHNTVAKNVANGGPGGIDCGIMAKTIDNSIVWGNAKGAGSQLFGSCTLANVDIDENAMGMGVIHLDPLFDAAYRLKDGSPCIDKIQASPVDHDLDGTKRPQRSAHDIGAHELK